MISSHGISPSPLEPMPSRRQPLSMAMRHNAFLHIVFFLCAAGFSNVLCSFEISSTERNAVREIQILPLTAYSLSFSYQTAGEINRQSKEVLTVTVSISGDAQKLKASGEPSQKRFSFVPSPQKKDILIAEDKLLMPNGAHFATVEFSLTGSGSAEISEPLLREIPLPADAVRTTKRIWRRQGAIREPAVLWSPEEQRHGVILYQREPSRIFPESIPQRHEICTGIRKFTTPGEFCNLHFALHFIQHDEIQSVTFSKLTTEDGRHAIPAGLWENYQVFFRRKPAWSNRKFFVIPENLYPFQPSSVTPGSNCFLWFQCRLPEDAVAGTYRGHIDVRCRTHVEKIPVFLRILPFRLKKPTVDWIMYGGNFYAGGWHNNSREDVQDRHFAEIASLGITGMIHHGGIYTEKDVTALCRRLDKAGMHGPLVIDFGWQLEATVFRKIYGKNIADHRKFPYPECADEKVRQGFVQGLTDLKQWMGKYFKGSAWYYQGLDEPHIYGGLSQAAWEYPLAKQAGAKTSSTVYPLREFKEFGKWNLDVSVNAQVKFSQRAFEDLQEAAEKQHTTLWLLGPGSYTSGSGIPNRYESGFLFFKTKLPGCVAWTYGGGPDVDELEVERMNMYVTYARKEFLKGEPLAENPARRVCWSTIVAEGLREGVLDYRYAYTLEQIAKEAKAKGIPVDSAEKLLAQLNGDMIPFWSEVNKNGTMDEPAMERIRWAISQEILTLLEATK